MNKHKALFLGLTLAIAGSVIFFANKNFFSGGILSSVLNPNIFPSNTQYVCNEDTQEKYKNLYAQYPSWKEKTQAEINKINISASKPDTTTISLNKQIQEKEAALKKINDQIAANREYVKDYCTNSSGDQEQLCAEKKNLIRRLLPQKKKLELQVRDLRKKLAKYTSKKDDTAEQIEDLRNSIEQYALFVKKYEQCMDQLSEKKSYQFASWECQDKTRQQYADASSCKPLGTWKQLAENFCQNRCSSAIGNIPGKCGVNTFAVSGPCDACGTAINEIFSTVPTNNLCSPGNATSTSISFDETTLGNNGNGMWVWRCRDAAGKTQGQTCAARSTLPPITRCSDTDVGLDYYIKGEVQSPKTRGFNNRVLLDQCVIKDTRGAYIPANSCDAGNCYINEGYCVSGVDHDTKQYACPNGCKDGACITPSDVYCTDDTVIDKYTKNTAMGVVAWWDPISSNVKAQEDYCSSTNSGSLNKVAESSYLVEFSCQSKPDKTDGRKIWAGFEVFTCSLGCKDGACMKPVCGNSKKEDDEECDDGNTVNTDNCSNTCKLPVCGNGTKEGSEECDDGNTVNTDTCSATCKIPTCGNGTKEGSEECDDGNTVNTDTCSATCKIPTCGNGTKEGSEECDDGNTVNTDNCNNACRLPVCGNNIKEGAEECDDGDTNATNGCRNDCKLPICGNNIKEGDEECDDGNTINTDTCSSLCKIPTCGNNVKEGSEECDDGDTNNTNGCNNTCRLPVCGNGIIEGVEQCDDGNTSNNDGCYPNCTIEPGVFCSGSLPANSRILTNVGATPSPWAYNGDTNCSFECLYGYTYTNNACVPSLASALTCTDSDSSLNNFFDVKGYTQSKNGTQIIQTNSDYCSADKILREQVCPTGSTADYIDHTCPYACQDGACVDATTYSSQTELNVSFFSEDTTPSTIIPVGTTGNSTYSSGNAFLFQTNDQTDVYITKIVFGTKEGNNSIKEVGGFDQTNSFVGMVNNEAIAVINKLKIPKSKLFNFYVKYNPVASSGNVPYGSPSTLVINSITYENSAGIATTVFPFIAANTMTLVGSAPNISLPIGQQKLSNGTVDLGNLTISHARYIEGNKFGLNSFIITINKPSNISLSNFKLFSNNSVLTSGTVYSSSPEEVVVVFVFGPKYSLPDNTSSSDFSLKADVSGMTNGQEISWSIVNVQWEDNSSGLTPGYLVGYVAGICYGMDHRNSLDRGLIFVSPSMYISKNTVVVKN